MTNAVTKFSAPMTVDDFLARTDLSRYELIDGDPRAMSPGSTVHARLQARLGRLIDQHLEKSGGPCWVGSEPAVRPRASAKHNIRVPDLGVTCAPDQSGEFIMTDPILLIELLSPGNSKDTRDNVWAYTTISSVREIVIVHTTRQRVELLRRQSDGLWPADPEIIDNGGTLQLSSIDASFALADIYAKTHLA